MDKFDNFITKSKFKQMKKILLTFIIIGMAYLTVTACPVCERNQPKLLKGLVHGAGPDGTLDYVIVGVVVLISIITLYLSIKRIMHPGEKQEDHIKRFIISSNDHE